MPRSLARNQKKIYLFTGCIIGQISAFLEIATLMKNYHTQLWSLYLNPGIVRGEGRWVQPARAAPASVSEIISLSWV